MLSTKLRLFPDHWGGPAGADRNHMTREPDETDDLSVVERLLFKKSGIVLERFNRHETLAGRTPDFKVMRDGKLFAFCEVKSPRDDWLEEQIETAPPGQLVGGPRSDPTFNRIARHIEKAASQLHAVNADHALPNILVFVNHADASHRGDLVETLTGTFETESGGRFPTVRHISEGRLGKVRDQIDLYIWIDRKTTSVNLYLFNDLTAPSVIVELCDLFGVDASDIRR
jgi:hypothetical protein